MRATVDPADSLQMAINDELAAIAGDVRELPRQVTAGLRLLRAGAVSLMMPA